MEEKIRKREQRKWGDKVHRQNSQLQKAEMWKDLTEETIYPIQFLCKSVYDLLPSPTNGSGKNVRT